MKKKTKSRAKKATKKKVVKKITKKKLVAKKMRTYSIEIRRSRSGKWRQTSDTVTASNKLHAVHIAAHRNPNRWVHVIV